MVHRGEAERIRYIHVRALHISCIVVYETYLHTDILLLVMLFE